MLLRMQSFEDDGSSVDACVSATADKRGPQTDCSLVHIDVKPVINWGVELGNREGKAPIFHAIGITRIHQPNILSIYVQGEKQTRLLAQALIFAGQTLLEELQGNVPTEQKGEIACTEMEFPWNMDQPLWRASWEKVPADWEEQITEFDQ